MSSPVAGTPSTAMTTWLGGMCKVAVVALLRALETERAPLLRAKALPTLEDLEIAQLVLDLLGIGSGDPGRSGVKAAHLERLLRRLSVLEEDPLDDAHGCQGDLEAVRGPGLAQSGAVAGSGCDEAGAERAVRELGAGRIVEHDLVHEPVGVDRGGSRSGDRGARAIHDSQAWRGDGRAATDVSTGDSTARRAETPCALGLMPSWARGSAIDSFAREPARPAARFPVTGASRPPETESRHGQDAEQRELEGRHGDHRVPVAPISAVGPAGAGFRLVEARAERQRPRLAVAVLGVELGAQQREARARGACARWAPGCRGARRSRAARAPRSSAGRGPCGRSAAGARWRRRGGGGRPGARSRRARPRSGPRAPRRCGGAARGSASGRRCGAPRCAARPAGGSPRARRARAEPRPARPGKGPRRQPRRRAGCARAGAARGLPRAGPRRSPLGVRFPLRRSSPPR